MKIPKWSVSVGEVQPKEKDSSYVNYESSATIAFNHKFTKEFASFLDKDPIKSIEDMAREGFRSGLQGMVYNEIMIEAHAALEVEGTPESVKKALAQIAHLCCVEYE